MYLIAKVIATGFLLLCLNSTVQAQDFDEWRQQHEGEFKEFKDERDTAFLKMLDEIWTEVESIEPDPVFDEPKIDLLPEAEIRPSVEEVDSEENEAVKVRPNIFSTAPPLPELIEEESFRAPEGSHTSEVIYYEKKLPFYYFRENMAHLRGLPSQESMKRYWEEMSRTEYKVLTDRLSQIIDRMNLNDWGVLNLTSKFGDEIYGSPGNNSRLFVWFMMTKLGYDVKAGFSEGYVYVLFQSEYRISNTRFFTLNGVRYYIILLDENATRPSTITTYEGDYPEIDRVFTLDIQQLPLLPGKMNSRELSFTWRQKEYAFSVPYNQNMVDYYRHFPTTEVHAYTMAANSEVTVNALLENLGAVIDGKNQSEAINILLRFVQTAFDYKTDTSQFGKQKFMLPEEILYYPYSDCDDRAILFAFLTHHLMGAEVVGLRYPGHLATAVNVDEDVDGDTLFYNGKRYVIADPTYINATAGMTMTKFRGVSPAIVPLFLN